jgi:Tfp pilus assembly protein PilF
MIREISKIVRSRVRGQKGTRVTTRLRAVVVCGLALCLSAPSWAASDAREAKEEMRFGYKVAREGYWQEALMRFRQADALQPNDPEILNNIAVALEATGDYESAREVYGRALALEPGNAVLRNNFQAFQQFYKENIADLEAPEELPGQEESETATDPGSGEGSEAGDDQEGGGDASGR